MKALTFSASRFTVFAFNVFFSLRTWKYIGIGIVLGSLWYSYYSFTRQFNIVYSHGVFGVITEAKWDEVVNSPARLNFLESENARLERQIESFRE